MAFRSDLDALILGVLQSGRLHGYEIGKRINVSSKNSLNIKEGQIYPILHRLENEGKIASEWEPQEGKPGRRVYSLTEAGRGELTVQREAWRQFSESVNQIIAPARLEANHV